MTYLFIFIGIVVFGGAIFALTRKKPEALPPAPAKPLLRTTAPANVAKTPTAPTKPVAADLESAEVSFSEPPPPLVSPSVPAKPAPPPPSAKAPEPRPPPKVLNQKEVDALRRGLSATRGGFMTRLKALFTTKKEIDDATLEQLEELMLSSDVGVKTTSTILGRLRDRIQREAVVDADAAWAALRAEAKEILSVGGEPVKASGKPTIVLMVGVNGVGKTTTIGKLATRATQSGQSVMLAAGDTFRAAAVQQLEIWGKRVKAEVVKGKEGSDPAAVAFDATNKAKESGVDILFIDTAGRLHTKSPLMDEIKKIKRSIGKALDGAPHETLLVVDATTGQNAVTQAAMFKEAIDLTGIVLTKLDGTAKGGVVLGICDELKLPVRYVGLGERAEDLREFDADEFVEALFGQDDLPPSSADTTKPTFP